MPRLTRHARTGLIVGALAGMAAAGWLLGGRPSEFGERLRFDNGGEGYYTPNVTRAEA
jgi:hypothetical protein